MKVTTTYRNPGKKPVSVDLVDSIRADTSFDKSPDGVADLFWAYDKWFGQAYGVVAEDHAIKGSSDARRSMLRYQDRDGKVAIRLEPGKSYELERRVIPGANLFDVRRVADQVAGRKRRDVRLTVKDSAGQPVGDADVVLEGDGKPVAWGRTERSRGPHARRAGEGGEADRVGPRSGLEGDDDRSGRRRRTSASSCPSRAGSSAQITDGEGRPIPCKVQFLGREGTESPDFGPDERRARRQERVLQPRRPLPADPRTGQV